MSNSKVSPLVNEYREVSVDVPSIAANTTAETRVKLPGFKVGRPCLVEPVSTLNAGLALAQGSRVAVGTDVEAESFHGSGLDDGTSNSGANYTGSKAGGVFLVEVDSVGGTDTFKWYRDGVLVASSVSMTGAAQALSDGVTITFAATTGHTLGDSWQIRVGLPQVVLRFQNSTAGALDPAAGTYKFTQL